MLTEPGDKVNSLFSVRSSRTPVNRLLLIVISATARTAARRMPEPDKRCLYFMAVSQLALRESITTTLAYSQKAISTM